MGVCKNIGCLSVIINGWWDFFNWLFKTSVAVVDVNVVVVVVVFRKFWYCKSINCKSDFCCCVAQISNKIKIVVKIKENIKKYPNAHICCYWSIPKIAVIGEGGLRKFQVLQIFFKFKNSSNIFIEFISNFHFTLKHTHNYTLSNGFNTGYFLFFFSFFFVVALFKYYTEKM